MSPTWFQIIILAFLQGAAELLPVSSSAHVILAEKLMGLDPSRPELTFLLVMLHTGTMFAVIAYFWSAWKESYFSSFNRFLSILPSLAVATVITFILGFVLKVVIEKVILGGGAKAEVEELFSNLPLVGGALAAAGLLIIVSGLFAKNGGDDQEITLPASGWIGIVQALCLPFRGFSRSGATISTALLLGINKRRAEEFSFALAVILTPPVIILELKRLLKANSTAAQPVHLTSLLFPGMVGMGCSFVAGLLALRLLSRWLETGRWHYFGFYCLAFAAVVVAFAWAGF
ncbi:MAG: undecaprenyl-diphosphate phosphatase [Methylacidiphilales bacterium]|nr:undecaprenyl-diphosphate phosphatase [Candidatus Methylacidiphilales bacterium]